MPDLNRSGFLFALDHSHTNNRYPTHLWVGHPRQRMSSWKSHKLSPPFGGPRHKCLGYRGFFWSVASICESSSMWTIARMPTGMSAHQEDCTRRVAPGSVASTCESSSMWTIANGNRPANESPSYMSKIFPGFNITFGSSVRFKDRINSISVSPTAISR